MLDEPIADQLNVVSGIGLIDGIRNGPIVFTTCHIVYRKYTVSLPKSRMDCEEVEQKDGN